MAEIILYAVGICGIILVGCGISWMLEVIYDSRDYRHSVTAEDLEEMARYFDEDGWFVAKNEKGEEFYCGYLKE